MNIQKKEFLLSAVLFFAIILPLTSVSAEIETTVTNDDLIKKKQSKSNKYLTAKQTYEIVKADAGVALFIDVRTLAEIEFVGWTPLVDVVIPYMTNDFEEWDEKKNRYLKVINGDFTVAFEDFIKAKGANKNTPIIFMCRSGARSSKAASLATKLGYTKAYTMVDGFEGDKAKEGATNDHRTLNGWKNNNLPWDYKMDIKKVLFNL